MTPTPEQLAAPVEAMRAVLKPPYWRHDLLPTGPDTYALRSQQIRNPKSDVRGPDDGVWRVEIRAVDLMADVRWLVWATVRAEAMFARA